MKGILVLLVLGFAGVAPGQDAMTFTNKFATFTNLQSEVFRDVRLVRADRAGVVYLVPGTVGGGRVPYTNLPPALLESFGIPTNWTVAAVIPAQPVMAAYPAEPEHTPTAPETNTEPRMNQEHQLELEITTNILGGDNLCLCKVTVKASRFEIAVTQFDKDSDAKVKVARSAEAEFAYDQKPSLKLLLEKFMEWEAIAAKNHAEDFERPIVVDAVTYPITEPTFRWWGEYGSGQLRFRVNDQFFSLDNKTAIGLLGILETIPAMREELAHKIRNRDLQKNLFR